MLLQKWFIKQSHWCSRREPGANPAVCQLLCAVSLNVMMHYLMYVKVIPKPGRERYSRMSSDSLLNSDWCFNIKGCSEYCREWICLWHREWIIKNEKVSERQVSPPTFGGSFEILKRTLIGQKFNYIYCSCFTPVAQDLQT